MDHSLMVTVKRYMEQILLAGIIGGLSMGVKYIARISDNVEQMTVAIQLLTEKLSNVDKLAQDHETRLRLLERQHPRRQ